MLQKASPPSVVAREAFWQLPRVWQRNPREPYAQRYTMSQGKRHPLRPAKPAGTSASISVCRISPG